ncbi:hypothetical protein ACLQ28_16550 [Micromonospora sp. DT201]|uniref:hypothetical protein n=1 Tax=Micromonospora sp. DT201 TaxID=3393442 RepID=UPI003CEECB49
MPELLWLAYMGVILYWVHDRSPGQTGFRPDPHATSLTRPVASTDPAAGQVHFSTLRIDSSHLAPRHFDT